MGYFISEAIVGPITKLKDMAVEVGKGKLDTKVEIKSKDEIGVLANSFNKMAEDLKTSGDKIIAAKNYTDNTIKSMIDTLIVIDPDAKLKTINPSVVELLGYKEEELIGKPVASIFAEEDPIFKGTKLKKLIEEESIRDYDIKYRTKKGKIIPVSLCGSVMRDKEGKLLGFVCIARDMREIKRLMQKEKDVAVIAATAANEKKKAQELQEAYKEVQLLANLVESAQYEMVFVLEPDGRIVRCNALARDTFGYSGDEILTRNIWSLLRADAQIEWKTIVDRIRQQSSWREKLTAICKDGRELPVEIDISGPASADENANMICFGRDITKETEVDRMKSEFISIVSHELRTPLTSVKNAVSIILGGRAGEITKNQERFLSMVNRNIDRLTGIINDLLDLSKLEAGKVELKFQEIDLNEPLDIVISSLMPKAENKSVTITKEIPVDLPKVCGDRDKIEQIFINLINNSIKFTPEGGRVHVSAKNHDLDKDFIEVCVEDTGVGIPVEELDIVFDKFHQISGSLTRKTGGTGLGLPIVKDPVEGHKGSIRVESEVGKGSGFIFTLPAYSSKSALKDHLDMEIARAREKGIPLSLVMLKIEESEYLSEVYGEEETLKILDQVKQVVQDTVHRTTDIINIQTTGRVIITLVDTPKEGAFALDNRLKDMLSKQTFKVGKESVRINLTSGIATYPEEGVTGDELMEKALLAMKQGS
jgi:PAS domain S-box-containing protein/diguanylate cyclase (GGDEF)-like protein